MMSDTNNLIESYHYQLKYIYARGQRCGRMDTLIELLCHVVWPAYIGRRQSRVDDAERPPAVREDEVHVHSVKYLLTGYNALNVHDEALGVGTCVGDIANAHKAAPPVVAAVADASCECDASRKDVCVHVEALAQRCPLDLAMMRRGAEEIGAPAAAASDPPSPPRSSTLATHKPPPPLALQRASGSSSLSTTRPAPRASSTSRRSRALTRPPPTPSTSTRSPASVAATRTDFAATSAATSSRSRPTTPACSRRWSPGSTQRPRRSRHPWKRPASRSTRVETPPAGRGSAGRRAGRKRVGSGATRAPRAEAGPARIERDHTCFSSIAASALGGSPRQGQISSIARGAAAAAAK